MTSPVTIRHAFVETIPEQLEPSILFVSLRFRTATHLCPTGCGEEVVTHLGPNDWTLTFDGTVSLRPSVGNWGLACRSHYWITRDELVWARTWTPEEVASWRETGVAPTSAAPEDHLERRGLVDQLRAWARRA